MWKGFRKVSESGCLRACCFLFPPLGAAEVEVRRCDRCFSLTHQFRGLYEGGSPALLHLSVFALHGTSALLLVGDLKKASDHSLDSGFIPCSGPPWIPLCLVKRTLSTLLRILLDHQESQRNQQYLTVPDLQPSPPWWIAPPK
ncbi:hypothetical protein AMECASPLE_009293 [Ameca splendens]|uniref:Secreted protein n=1 Tax=Ameca splendens TaxID=208324 RepID=A0ABV0Y088_9TELE